MSENISEINKLLKPNMGYITEKDDKGFTPLMEAIKYHKNKALAILLDYKVDMKATNKFGDYPAHIAAYAGNYQALELLHKHGADLYVVSKNRKSILPLDIAIERIKQNNSLSIQKTIGCLLYYGSPDKGHTSSHKLDSKSILTCLKNYIDASKLIDRKLSFVHYFPLNELYLDDIRSHIISGLEELGISKSLIIEEVSKRLVKNFAYYATSIKDLNSFYQCYLADLPDISHILYNAFQFVFSSHRDTAKKLLHLGATIIKNDHFVVTQCSCGIYFRLNETFLCPNCKSEATLRDTYSYIGDFWDDIPHGSGVLYLLYLDEKRYVGQWLRGKFDGQGTYYSGEKILYEGTYKNGLYHGSGTWDNGSTFYYSGEYSYGKKHGKGKSIETKYCEWPNAQIDYILHQEGVFNNDVLMKGIMKYYNVRYINGNQITELRYEKEV